MFSRCWLTIQTSRCPLGSYHWFMAVLQPPFYSTKLLPQMTLVAFDCFLFKALACRRHPIPCPPFFNQCFCYLNRARLSFPVFIVHISLSLPFTSVLLKEIVLSTSNFCHPTNHHHHETMYCRIPDTINTLSSRIFGESTWDLPPKCQPPTER
jgi:hypothetical protein